MTKQPLVEVGLGRNKSTRVNLAGKRRREVREQRANLHAALRRCRKKSPATRSLLVSLVYDRHMPK